MKKFFVVSLVVIAIVAFAGVAVAGQVAQSNTGCGLGSMVFQDNKNVDDSLLLQLVMTLLNGTSGNQTFGITSGTSNCKKPSKIVKNDEVQQFVVANLDELAKDIARGQGETLDTLAEMMNIPASERAQVYGKLQNNFAKIFPSENVEATEVLDNIVDVING